MRHGFAIPAVRCSERPGDSTSGAWSVRGFVEIGVILVIGAYLQACASVLPRNPLPEALIEVAVLPGMPSSVRMWGDELPVDVDRRIARAGEQMIASGRISSPGGHHFLTISGGGATGAFGAGLLKGWSESGQRPEFLIVTGVSTGALIAPYAFLGSDYDDELEALYTGIKTSDLMKKRTLLKGLTGDAMADTEPLRNLLKKHVDKRMIDAIAMEYGRGRRLLIATTNIDAQRPVIWNVGRIATKSTEASRQLIRDVMLASASIPGAFPPVRIKVEAGGEVYDELHVDGGASGQVFLYPAHLNIREAAEQIGAEDPQTVYVIRNAILTPHWSAVKPKLAPVLKASISTLIRTQGLGDIYRIYLGSVRDGMQFRLASVPPGLQLESAEVFDVAYMKGLFDFAYESARNGYDWQTSPPGIVVPQAGPGDVALTGPAAALD